MAAVLSPLYVAIGPSNCGRRNDKYVKKILLSNIVVFMLYTPGGLIDEDGRISTRRIHCGAKLILGVFVELCYSFQILLRRNQLELNVL